MPQVTFILKDGSQKSVEAPEGLSLMEVAIKNDIEEVEGACGGSLACATCHVYVEPKRFDETLPEDGISEEEEDMLDLAFDLRKTSRLCCQMMIDDSTDGLTVAVPGAKTDW